MAAFVTLACLAMLPVQPAPARPVELTIVHTTDLHGNIWPTVDYDGRANVGGFLRCAARIEAIRKEQPNTLLIDCGDTFQGSPESYLTRGRLMIEGLNTLQYDAWILGNHEFDWGADNLRKLHDLAEVPFLAANLYFQDPGSSWLPKIRPYLIREIEGIKVAVVGLTTPGIPRWSRPHLLQGALFKQSVESLREVLPLVKAEDPDIIILAVHQGFKHRGDDFANQIEAIARSFPEVDVILGGHSHVAVEDMRFGEVLFTQAGYHGIWLGRVDLVYDTVQRKLIERRARLEVMDEKVPFHDGLIAVWGDELAAVSNTLSRNIGDNPADLDPKPDAHGRSSMQQLICRAIAWGTGAEIVLHGSLGDQGVGAGPLVYRDAWRIVPYENTLGLLSLTPQEIREVLVENFSRPLTPNSMGPYGLSFQLERKGSEVLISDMRDGEGQPLHGRKRYRVAMNSYVLASGGERHNRVRALAGQPESRLDMLDLDTRNLVLRYIEEHFVTPEEVSQPVNGTERVPVAP